MRHDTRAYLHIEQIKRCDQIVVDRRSKMPGVERKKYVLSADPLCQAETSEKKNEGIKKRKRECGRGSAVGIIAIDRNNKRKKI